MAEGPTFSGYILGYGASSESLYKILEKTPSFLDTYSGNKIGTKSKYLNIESSTQTGTEGQHPNIEP
ncbi:18832_t:CDS:2, partial [Racocetra persica]